MAGITKRFNSGMKPAWIVLFRRSGMPQFSMTFYNEDEAKAFVKAEELNYLKDPVAFRKRLEGVALRRRRQHEISTRIEAGDLSE